MILSVDEARAHVSTGMSDEALLTVLEATEADIEASAPATLTVYKLGGYASLVLDYPIGSVSTVVESWDTTPITLDATDYVINGLLLRRLATGTTPASSWAAKVKVTYTPSAALAVRKQAQAILIRRNLMHGVTSEAIGDFSTSYSATSWKDQTEQAFALLGPMMVA